MKLEVFMRALEVAEPSLFNVLSRTGELPITYAWYLVAALWESFDTNRPMPFATDAELLVALRAYDLSEDETIAYFDTCEIELMTTGYCRHTAIKQAVAA